MTEEETKQWTKLQGLKKTLAYKLSKAPKTPGAIIPLTKEEFKLMNDQANVATPIQTSKVDNIIAALEDTKGAIDNLEAYALKVRGEPSAARLEGVELNPPRLSFYYGFPRYPSRNFERTYK